MTRSHGLLHRPAAAKTNGALPLCIGGIGFSVTWEDPRLANWLRYFFTRFVRFVGNGEPMIRLSVRSDACPGFSKAVPLFDADRNWRLYHDGSRLVFEIFDSLTGARQAVAVVREDLQAADVYPFPVPSEKPPPAWSLPRLMQPLGQLLLITLLSRLEGIMVHAAAVDDRGRGLVFVGPSGAGKSTLVGFWRRRAGVRILSDECVILRRRGDKMWAYGTPWSGLQVAVTAYPGPVEVQRIFFIGHASEHRTWDEPAGTLAAHFFSQLFLPFWDRGAIARSLDFCRALVMAPSCRRLGFAKHPSVVSFLRNH